MRTILLCIILVALAISAYGQSSILRVDLTTSAVGNVKPGDVIDFTLVLTNLQSAQPPIVSTVTVSYKDANGAQMPDVIASSPTVTVAKPITITAVKMSAAGVDYIANSAFVGAVAIPAMIVNTDIVFTIGESIKQINEGGNLTIKFKCKIK